MCILKYKLDTIVRWKLLFSLQTRMLLFTYHCTETDTTCYISWYKLFIYIYRKKKWPHQDNVVITIGNSSWRGRHNRTESSIVTLCPLSEVSYNTRCKASRVAPKPLPRPSPPSQTEHTLQFKARYPALHYPGLLGPLVYEEQRPASPPPPKRTHLIDTHTLTFSVLSTLSPSSLECLSE